MNPETLKEKITFKTKDVSNNELELTASLTISCHMLISQDGISHFKGRDKTLMDFSKDCLKEKILRELYEDGRHQMAEMLLDLARTTPFGFEFHDKLSKIISLARRIQPDLLKGE